MNIGTFRPATGMLKHTRLIVEAFIHAAFHARDGMLNSRKFLADVGRRFHRLQGY